MATVTGNRKKTTEPELYDSIQCQQFRQTMDQMIQQAGGSQAVASMWQSQGVARGCVRAPNANRPETIATPTPQYPPKTNLLAEAIAARKKAEDEGKATPSTSTPISSRADSGSAASNYVNISTVEAKIAAGVGPEKLPHPIDPTIESSNAGKQQAFEIAGALLVTGAIVAGLIIWWKWR